MFGLLAPISLLSLLFLLKLSGLLLSEREGVITK